MFQEVDTVHKFAWKSLSQHKTIVYRTAVNVFEKISTALVFLLQLVSLHQSKNSLDNKKWYEMHFRGLQSCKLPKVYKLGNFQRFTNLQTCKGLQVKSRSLNDFVNLSSKKLIRYATLRKTSVRQHEINVYRQVWKLLNKSAPHMSFSCNLWHLHQPKDNLDDKKWYEMYFPIGYKLVHFRRFTNLYTCKVYK